MKRLYFLLLVSLFVTHVAHAQLQKGNFQLGGSLNIYDKRTTYFDSSQEPFQTVEESGFGISPQFGYFLSESWVLGVSLSKKARKFKNSNPSFAISTEKSSSWGTGIFARKFIPVNEKLAFFGELETGIDWISLDIVQNPDNNPSSQIFNYNNFSTQFSLGVAFFPKKWISIETSISPLSYSYSNRTDNQVNVDTNYKTHDFNFGINTSSIFLGINFFINRQ
ncbi:outer membrane beta-barrel protein [Cognataquiflexum aquatile]|uniref:outer membrane beta-barrel protein n=1 Tax=Cognataquiflexum aquatile TaxID=2249427 RepID=UPI000DE9718A|nr:outer membrane beta-barrel protein [Cognataquiflexum aquatile]